MAETTELPNDDYNAPGNMTPEAYQAEHERRAEELGANGLHVVPVEFTDRIERQVAGNA